MTRGSFILSDDDCDLVSEFLIIARRSLLELADTHERMTGHAMIAERLRLHADVATDLREKIEQR